MVVVDLAAVGEVGTDIEIEDWSVGGRDYYPAGMEMIPGDFVPACILRKDMAGGLLQSFPEADAAGEIETYIHLDLEKAC
jgi:hypothetical protein